jgi:hypothetical protein
VLPVVPAVFAQAPDPPWRLPEAPLRAVFAAPAGHPFCLAQLPAVPVAGMPAGAVAAFHGDVSLPVRVAAADGATLHVLVNCSGVSAGAAVALYAITNGATIRADASFADPLPVRVDICQAGGDDTPPGWEAMLFMATRHTGRRVSFLAEGLAPIQSQKEGERNWYEGGWRRPVYVARLSGRLLIERGGDHRFALRSRRPVCLLIDGRPAVDNTRPDASSWRIGAPPALAAGVHEYEFLHLCGREIDFAAGWIPPGETDVQPLPQQVLLTAAGPVAARIERLGAVLHAGADCRLEPGYSFHGVPVVFTPATLRSLHVAWEGARGVSCRWRLDGAVAGEGPLWRHVFTGGGPRTVELEVVDEDSGAREAALLEVTIPAVPATEYRLAGRLEGVPAICYDDDPVNPEIRLRGTAPPDLPLAVEATWTDGAGGTNRLAGEVRLGNGWGRLPLPAGRARDYGVIRWRVRHAGVVLIEGGARFVRPPFDRLPADLDGDLLTDGAEVCVLVPRRASSGHPQPFPGLRGGQRIVLLDGFLVPDEVLAPEIGEDFDRRFLAALQLFGGRPVAPVTNAVHYRRLSFAALGGELDGRGPGRLAPLAALARLQPADTVVVAPQIPGPEGGETLAEFERRLAALAGLLRDALRCQVVLVTPPPGRSGLPPGAPDPARPWAEAVLRVADAYGLTVADLFTACHTRLAVPPVADGRLTAAGRELAAETLARTLAGGR